MKQLSTLLALFLAVLALAPGARAQGLLLNDPTIDGDELDCIVMTLALDEEQQDQLDELLVLYSLELGKIYEELQALEDREDREDFSIEWALELWEDMSARIDEHQTVLFDDLSFSLTDEQVRRIPTCRSRLRRMGITNGGSDASLPGGVSLGTDPVILAIEMRLPSTLDADHTARFEQALTVYDASMKKNIDGLEGDIMKLAKGARGFEDNPFAGVMALQGEIRALVKSAKSLREDHQGLGLAVARTLPPKEAEEWTDAFMRALYPGPHARTTCETLLERLLDQTVLTDEEFSAVLRINADLRAKLSPVRKKWCDELDDALRDFEFNLLTIASFDLDRVGRPFEERVKELDEQALAILRERVKNDVVERLIESMTNTAEQGERPGRPRRPGNPEDEAEREAELEISIETSG